ncbi:MAG: EAL domain-containing protein [Ketobacter sp.]|nr:MAG: EAL domain-containing protein [Ketobacter sp.]
MLFQLSALRSKLGRKFFLLVFLAALLPMLLFASFAYNYIGSYLYHQSQQDLRNEARFYSSVLYERLLLVSSQFRSGKDAEAVLPEQAESGAVRWTYRSWGDLDTLLKKWPEDQKAAARTRLHNGELLLISQPDGRAVLLLRAPDQPERLSLQMADLNVNYLMGDPGMRDPQMDYCLFGSYDELLLCSDSSLIASAQFSQLMRDNGLRPAFQTEWQQGGQTHLVQIQSLFLDNKFGAPSWKLWVSQSRSDVMGALTVLQRALSLLVAATILLAAIVSAVQIKRILQPLNRLMEGTRAVANRQFDISLAIDSNDELSDVADAFNQMAQQIGKQFQLLTTLSNIDQLILSVPDLDQVAHSILSTMQDLIQSDAAAVALRDPDNIAEMCVYSYHSTKVKYQVDRRELGDDERHWLGVVSPMHRTSSNDVKYLSWLWPEQTSLLAGNTYLFPITVNSKNRGVLALSWEQPTTLSEQDRSLLKDFADRLAVAITAVRREKQLYRQAHFDGLTGLPNRQLLKDRLEQSLKHAIKNFGSGAVLFVDLDRFQKVNDIEGHSLGDQILVKAAERLQVCVTLEDTVARQGGDEFLIVLNNIDTPMRATRVADKILTMLSSPFNVEGKKYFLTASVGIAVFPSDGQDVNTLLRKVDTAMHRAKHEGGAQYRYFEEEMNRASQRRMTAERRIRDALEQDHVELHYQPQWYMQKKEISVEALVRIRDSEAGLLLPGEFIDVAEDTGLILDVGEWVVRQACEQMAAWRQQQLPVRRVSVNVSGRQLARADFVSVVQSAVEDFELQYDDLELEVTETILIGDADSAVKKLGELSALGVTIAIDDFGTGYSSLSYLHTLPFDLLKIDQNFVADLDSNPISSAITRTIIDLAKSFNKEVMAEGVETQQQLLQLQELECDAVQGFFVSRPLTSVQVTSFVRDFDPLQESKPN